MKNISTNLSIKLLSLVISVILWAIIMNIINPLVNGFVSLPVSVENEMHVLEQNKTYTITDSKIIKVNYKVKSDFQTNVRQNDFRVYIDLNDLDTSNKLSVHYEVLNGVDSYISNVQLEPSVLHVTLDDVSRNEYAVKYELNGNIGPGHSVGSVILSPNIVFVSGSNAIIDSIDHISIDIPVKNNNETFSGVAVPKLVTKDGNVLPKDGIILSADEINYSVVVYSSVSVTLNAVVDGNVKTGYSYAGTQVYPNTIMINGPRSVIQNIYTIDLPKINIDGLIENTDYVYKTSEILPIGITSNTEQIMVSIMINDNVLNRPATNASGVGPHVDETIEESDSLN